MDRNEKSRGLTLRGRLLLLVAMTTLPFAALTGFLLQTLKSYGDSYDSIISNMTVANSYNLNFKEELDEDIYKLVAQGTPFEKPGGGEEMTDRTNPYCLTQELRGDFQTLAGITTDSDSRSWLNSLLRNIDTLDERLDDIRINLDEGGHYSENIEMLDNNIYILTELIQDDIQHYIYYQTKGIELLKDALNRQLSRLVVILILVAAAIIASTFLHTLRTVRSITGPLEELRSVTGRIAEGDFSARARTGMKAGPEISDVARSVNDMAGRLKRYVEKIKDDERKMRNQELRLLQEQINPHFLYNALDAIIWLIEAGKTEEAEDMVVSLSNFFKLVLSRGHEFITIREEEMHIRSYLEIQSVRYHDILSYEIRIDPVLYHCRILKLTLQPLVENALYHGIKEKREGGRILITGNMNAQGQILLTVEDNGAGMDEEELLHLRKAILLPCSETDRGFGMANVNERIRMHFGQQYGMTVDSRKGEGTKVAILLPAQWQKETGSEAADGTKEEAGADEQKIL